MFGRHPSRKLVYVWLDLYYQSLSHPSSFSVVHGSSFVRQNTGLLSRRAMSRDVASNRPTSPDVSPIDDTNNTSTIQPGTQSRTASDGGEHEQRGVSGNANSHSANGNNGAASTPPLIDIPEPQRTPPASDERQELLAEVTTAPQEVTVKVQRTTKRHVADAINGTSTTQPTLAAAAPRLSNAKHKHTSFGLIHAWILELFACLFAAIIVAIEVVLLSYYANESYRTWNHEWAINSVFAFLTALLEAAVAFSVGSCLGQLRWLWFQKNDSSLKWMDRLTNAKSPPGALRFVFSHRAYRYANVWPIRLMVSRLTVEQALGFPWCASDHCAAWCWRLYAECYYHSW